MVIRAILFVSTNLGHLQCHTQLIFIREVFILFQLIHGTVVDTSMVFPHRLGLPFKRALKNLMAEYLKKIIQDDGRFCS